MKQLYPLHKKQLEVSSLPPSVKYRLFGGARGGGKSYWLRSEVAKLACGRGNTRGLVLRRTFPEVYENTIIPMLSELPREIYTYNHSKGIMTFFNGSTVKFSYCRNFQDVLRYQGVEYDFIAIEELTHWTFEEWRALMASLRTSKGGIVPNFFGTTNPGSIGHKWVKRLWITREFFPNEKPDEYGFVQSFVYDNPTLLDNDPAYLETLKALPEMQRRAFLEGDWDVFEGQYFDEFRREIHVCNPHIPSGRKIIALDYGYSNPSAIYWLNKSTQGKITCYRELYVTKHTYKQLALRIKALTGIDEQIEAVIVDPAVLNKKSDATGTSFKDEAGPLLEWKIIGANNERINGWNVVRQALKKYIDPNTNLVTSILEVCSNCVNLIRTLPELVYDKVNVEDLDTHGEDHAADALRYGLMYLGVDKLSFELLQKINQSLTKTKPNRESQLKKRLGEKDILNENF